MLHRLFKRASPATADPLSNLDTVSRWMQDVPAGDIYAALSSVIGSLIRLNQTQTEVSKDRLQVLMHLDEQSRDIHATLCDQYMRNPRMSKSLETRMWSSINAFLWETTRGYHSLLMDYVNNPGASKIQQFIPLVTARGIRGFSDLFKWKYIRYEKPDERLWLRLHNLYRISEFESFHNKPLTVYLGENQSSCTAEYMQSILLSAIADGGAHSPRHIEMVNTWLDKWPNIARMERTYVKERHHFYVDTAQGRGMRSIQIQEAFKGIQTILYIDTHPLLVHIARTEEKVRSGTSPVTLGMGEDFRVPDGYDVLTRTAECWSYTTGRNRRRSERIPCDSNLESARDLDCAHQMLSMYGGVQHHRNPSDRIMTNEEMLDIKIYGFVTERTKSGLAQSSPKSVCAVDMWQLIDRSKTGLGVLAQEDKPIKPGTLVAIRASKQEEWQPGVVRRIARQHDSVSVILGLELMPHDSSPVYLSDESSIGHHEISIADVDCNTDVRTDIKALKLSDNNAGKYYVILPSINYSNGRRYAMRTGNQIQLVRLGGVVGKGDGWVQSSYSTMDTSRNSEYGQYEHITVVGSGNNLSGDFDV